MLREPAERFGDELTALIGRWRDKPLDDQLTVCEMTGALEYVKADLLRDAQSPASRRASASSRRSSRRRRD